MEDISFLIATVIGLGFALTFWILIFKLIIALIRYLNRKGRS